MVNCLGVLKEILKKKLINMSTDNKITQHAKELNTQVL